MYAIESLLVDALSGIFGVETLNAVLRNPRTTAILLASLIAVTASVLGSFLVLRRTALMTDAISHTVLLGIVVAFLLVARFGEGPPNLSSPLMILGASAAGLATVLLTDLVRRSGLMREDAALGLVFPLLFALAVLLVSRYADDAHLDTHAVMIGEIGVAWADTRAHTRGAQEPITISPGDPRAETARRCLNCAEEGIGPRDPAAVFESVFVNCGTYTAGAAFQAGLTDEAPVQVFWPRSLTPLVLITLLSLTLVVLFFNELKLATFDPALARSLGRRPELLMLGLMSLVSVVAVAACNAVGSILVIAFFIIPPAAAHLLTDRLARMLGIGAGIGLLSAFWGYDLSRGRLFGVLALPGDWDTSISASMVLMMLLLFGLIVMLAPRHGLVVAVLRRWNNARRFRQIVLLETLGSDPAGIPELGRSLGWTRRRTRSTVSTLQRRGELIGDGNGGVYLSAAGRRALERFREELMDQATSA